MIISEVGHADSVSNVKTLMYGFANKLSQQSPVLCHIKSCPWNVQNISVLLRQRTNLLTFWYTLIFDHAREIKNIYLDYDFIEMKHDRQILSWCTVTDSYMDHYLSSHLFNALSEWYLKSTFNGVLSLLMQSKCFDSRHIEVDWRTQR